jgi:hypothetical protein
MARTIQDAVDDSAEQIELDDLVNFGSCPRTVIDPTTGPRSYWFRFGDIRHLTLPQIHAAIGEIAAAGQPGHARYMRVSDLPNQSFTRRPPTSFFGLEEFTIDRPVVVKCSIDVS